MITATQPANLAKFRQVYADAVRNVSESGASDSCNHHWHGPRVSLADAAELFTEIQDGYNDFEHDMIAKLAAEFADDGIEATPAREGSPAIYLHFPDADESRFMICALKRDVKEWIEQNLKADEIDVVTKFSCLQEGETELVGEALRIWWD